MLNSLPPGSPKPVCFFLHRFFHAFADQFFVDAIRELEDLPKDIKIKGGASGDPVAPWMTLDNKASMIMKIFNNGEDEKRYTSKLPRAASQTM